MLRFLKGFFGKPKHPDVTPAPEPLAPYKVEAPVAEVAPPPAPVVEETKPAKKKPAAKKAPVAAIKASAKPRAPRKPKSK